MSENVNIYCEILGFLVFVGFFVWGGFVFYFDYLKTLKCILKLILIQVVMPTSSHLGK